MSGTHGTHGTVGTHQRHRHRTPTPSIRDTLHAPEAERPREADEPALVASAQAASSPAFSQLYRRYEASIFNFLYRYLLDKEVAEELTQDTFLKAWVGIAATSDELPGKFGGWLFRIATNLLYDRFRHERLVQMDRWDRWVSPAGLWLGWEPAAAAWRFRCPESLLVQDDEQPELALLSAPEPALLEQVREVLDELPPTYRLCLVLREYRGLSYREVAAVLDMTQAAVKSVLYRAREAFRRRWTQTVAAPA